MIAPPTFIYERITLPLQMLASRLGEVSLEAAGYSVLREGNILELVGERLAVEEACSGIRSLVALFFLCLIYCYFFVPRKSIRAILLLSAIPIAIVTNAGRIFATGVLGQYDRELAHGVLHPALGHASLISAAVLCVLLHRGIKRTWPNASRRHG
jgi:exosortase